MRHAITSYMGVPGAVLLTILVIGALKAWEQRRRD